MPQVGAAVALTIAYVFSDSVVDTPLCTSVDAHTLIGHTGIQWRACVWRICMESDNKSKCHCRNALVIHFPSSVPTISAGRLPLYLNCEGEDQRKPTHGQEILQALLRLLFFHFLHGHGIP